MNTRKSTCCWHRRILLPLSLLCLLPTVSGTILLRDVNRTLASLPGLFGRPMSDDRLYKVRLQFLPENPYLCDEFNPNTTTYVRPTGPEIPTSDGNFTLADPVALLAARGECPFQRKARIAEEMDDFVEFLIVYNFNYDGEDTLVPMYSEYGSTRLFLLSITHRAGIELKHYIADQPEHVKERGGPIIFCNSDPPEGVMSLDDLQDMMLSAIGLFFMLISASSCLMICVGTSGYMDANGRIVFRGPTDHPATPVIHRGLLTEEQVRQVAEAMKNTTTSDSTAEITETSEIDMGEAPSCAVCLDEFEGNDNVVTLPCTHKFHNDCIVPWLTERQSKCPLCKYDVMQYVVEMEASNPSSQRVASLWNRISRYRWTQVQTMDEMRDGVVIDASEMGQDDDDDDGDVELELTEQRRVT